MPLARQVEEDPPVELWALELLALSFIRSRQSRRELKAFLKDAEESAEAWAAEGASANQRAAGDWARRALPVMKALARRI